MTCFQQMYNGVIYRFASRADCLEWLALQEEYVALINSDEETAPAAVEEVLKKKEAIEEKARTHVHL